MKNSPLKNVLSDLGDNMGILDVTFIVLVILKFFNVIEITWLQTSIPIIISVILTILYLMVKLANKNRGGK